MSEGMSVGYQSLGRSNMKSFNPEAIRRTTDLIKGTNNFKNIDADSMEKIRDYIEKTEVKEGSKFAPLKTLALSLATIGIGVLVSRGSANRLFYAIKDKQFVQKYFGKLGEKLFKFMETASKNAKLNETAGTVRKYFFKGVEYVTNKIGNIAQKGIAKDAPEFATKVGENLTKKAFQTVGTGVGLVSTGAALSVDKDSDGKSDILTSGDVTNAQKKNQAAVVDLVTAIIDAV